MNVQQYNKIVSSNISQIIIEVIVQCTIFTILLTFLDKSCNAHMLQVCIIAIWSQGPILNTGRSSYATFGTKIPVFRDNSGCLLGTK